MTKQDSTIEYTMVERDFYIQSILSDSNNKKYSYFKLNELEELPCSKVMTWQASRLLRSGLYCFSSNSFAYKYGIFNLRITLKGITFSIYFFVKEKI